MDGNGPAAQAASTTQTAKAAHVVRALLRLRPERTLTSIPNLTAEQRQRISDMLNTAKAQTAPLHGQIVAARKEMATLWAADTVDKQSIAAKESEIEGALGKIKTVWADFFMQLHDVLTPAQRACVALHGPATQDDMGMGGNCPCNQPQEK